MYTDTLNTTSIIHRHGPFDESGLALNLPQELVATITKLLNCSKSANTWRAEASVQRQIESVSEAWSIDLSFPWGREKALAFVAALSQRNLKASSIKV